MIRVFVAVKLTINSTSGSGTWQVGRFTIAAWKVHIDRYRPFITSQQLNLINLVIRSAKAYHPESSLVVCSFLSLLHEIVTKHQPA